MYVFYYHCSAYIGRFGNTGKWHGMPRSTAANITRDEKSSISVSLIISSQSHGVCTQRQKSAMLNAFNVHKKAHTQQIQLTSRYPPQPAPTPHPPP
jgi:hypothetical protein